MARRWLGVFLGLLARVLGATLRTAKRGEAQRARALDKAPGGILYAFWHEQQMQAILTNDTPHMTTIASRSKDGDIIAAALSVFSIPVARGSSSRGGGPALHTLRHWVERGRSVAVTVDGPRGPRHGVKPGIVELARLTGRPIVPTAVVVDRAWRMRSWDKFAVAKPFARVLQMFGEPIWVNGAVEPESARQRLQEALIALNAEAEAALCAQRKSANARHPE